MDYIIVSTSKCKYQEWQIRALYWSILKTNQKGKLIVLLSDDINHSNETTDFNIDPSIEIHELPDWAKEWETNEGEWWGGIPNKHESIKWLTENRKFNPDDRLLFLDPDMVFIKPVDLYPKDNQIIAQEWLNAYPDRKAFMYPFALKIKTLLLLIDTYRNKSIEYRRDTYEWISDMYGLDDAAAHHNIDVEYIEDLGRCTPWNDDNSTNESSIIHYPNEIFDLEKNRIFFKQDFTFNTSRRIEVFKARNKIDNDLLLNLDQYRTDYFYELKYSFPYLFKNYTGEDGHLYIQPWSGGFNNIRMSLELAICFSYLLNRTLILPERYSMYLLENESHFEDFFDLNNLGIKWIQFDSFCKETNLEPNLESLKNISQIITDKSVLEVVNFEKINTPEEFLKGREEVLYDKKFDLTKIIYFDKNLLGSFYQSVYSKHDIRLNQLICKHLTYRKDIRDLAWKFINILEDRTYHSLHIRRNDFQYKDLNISSEEIVENIQQQIPKGSKLYIATDNDINDEIFQIFRDNYHVFFYEDLEKILKPGEFDPNWIPIVEQLICSRAKKFVGNKFSTLSSYVYRIRGYMDDISDKKYYINTEKYDSQKQVDFLSDNDYVASWSREYPTAWKLNDESIFVSIASYRDSKVKDTIINLFEKCSNPDRLRVVVALQDEQSAYDEILKLPYPNLEVLFTEYQNTKGVVWARNRIRDKFENEDYFLQLDSHMRFKNDWDLILVNQHKSMSNNKVIISTYPNHCDIPDVEEEYLKLPFNAPLVFRNFLNSPESMDNRWRAKNLDSLNDFEIYDNKRISAAFLFVKGNWVNEVKMPEQMVFSGEEDAMTYLSFLKGWDIKLPSEACVYHNYDYKTKDNEPYRIHNNSYFLNDNAANEVNKILFDGTYERTLDELEKYFEITLRKPGSKNTKFIKINNSENILDYYKDSSVDSIEFGFMVTYKK